MAAITQTYRWTCVAVSRGLVITMRMMKMTMVGDVKTATYITLMPLMSQTAVGAATLTTRGSDSDKIALSVRVKAKLGPNFPAQDPVALGHLVLGYGGKITTRPPPRAFTCDHTYVDPYPYTNTCQRTA